jgi:hypothetical protein
MSPEVVAALIAVTGTAVVAVVGFLTTRSVTQKTIKAQGDQLDKTLAEERVRTLPDRFTKAIEQLGSDKLDVRIGGIYALERVAHDSNVDHPTVMEVLSSFVRRHSQEELMPPCPGGREPRRSIRPDVQAAITVIGRRNEKYDIRVLDLNMANLTEAILDAKRLTALFLDRDVVYLGSEKFTWKPCIGVYLGGAKFVHATLKHAKLTFAYLHGADLTRANLYRADLRGADLTRAILKEANLTHADLNDAILGGADFTDAIFSKDARIPEGWMRDSGSGRLERATQHIDASGNLAPHISPTSCTTGYAVDLFVLREGVVLLPLDLSISDVWQPGIQII